MFQLMLLKVSKKKWKNPRVKYEYAKPDNMYTLESQEFSNQLHFALYGETWTEREAKPPHPFLAVQPVLYPDNCQSNNVPSKWQE